MSQLSLTIPVLFEDMWVQDVPATYDKVSGITKPSEMEGYVFSKAEQPIHGCLWNAYESD